MFSKVMSPFASLQSVLNRPRIPRSSSTTRFRVINVTKGGKSLCRAVSEFTDATTLSITVLEK